MTSTTATVYPTSEHGKIVIRLYDLGDQIYPSSATCGALDDIPMGWLRDNWPCEPGWFWERDDCNHATVKRLA